MATTAVDRVLIDTNVLLYASFHLSPWHAPAIQSLHTLLQSGVELWVSRQILREYMAVMTRPGATTLTSPATVAATHVEAFENMFKVADETNAVTTRLLALVRSVAMGGKQIHDANLVATMQVYGISKLLTNNGADFARFGAAVSVIPLTASASSP